MELRNAREGDRQDRGRFGGRVGTIDDDTSGSRDRCALGSASPDKNFTALVGA